MSRKYSKVVILVLVLLMSVSTVALGRPAQQQEGPASPQLRGSIDNLPNPLAARRDVLRREAIVQRVRGQARGAVIQVAPGQFVEQEVNGAGIMWALAAEFGNEVNPDFGGSPGPRHNLIPQPNRSTNNTTIWQPDFNRAYYKSLLFSDSPGALSLRNYFVEQSSGDFAPEGDVSAWVRVPFNSARYGANLCGSIVCETVWDFVQDSVDTWYDRQQADGLTSAEINAYLSRFDVWDRYDYDGDGNFDEPDGYIDRFHSIFAGENDSSGFSDAISGHRWYAFYDDTAAGPSFNKAGGARIGNSNYWIGDYMMTPENTSLGRVAYLLARDLGLPSLHDSGFLENSTGFWTLMGFGYLAHDGVNGIGVMPTALGPWEKLQLGWLDYEDVYPGMRSTYQIGSAHAGTGYPRALLVHLPDKVITTEHGTPFAGEHFYQSDDGDDVDNRLFREFDLPAGAGLTAQVRYLLEPDWDYAYLIASHDGGATWENVETNLSTIDNPNGQNFGHGITGGSSGEWVELTADLSAYTGPTLLGFRHWTDNFTTPDLQGPFQIDEITVSGYPVDGAESDAGWTFDPPDGFRAVMGVETHTYFNAYLAEYRQYQGFDQALRTGPYTFVTETQVHSFPYQDGLLIWYWDTSQTDNNVSFHQGHGLILPIDARPKLMRFDPNGYWSATIQSYDATFGKGRTDPITLYVSRDEVRHVPSRFVSPLFDDNRQYWDPDFPFFGSVIHPHTNTRIRVLAIRPGAGVMRVAVKGSDE